MTPSRLGRRDFLALMCGASAWPITTHAQQPARLRRIGILLGTSESDPEAQQRIAAFTQSLREIGWSDGKEIRFEKRYAEGHPERLQSLAAELVQANVDVIVTEAAQAVDAAHKATRTIPIVMSYIGDALASGYVASLARPGGNVTGQTLVATDQAAKRLELIRTFLPSISRIAVLSNLNASGHRRQRQEMEPAAPKLGIVLQSLPMTSRDEIDGNLRAAVQAGAQAIVTMEDPMVESARAHIVGFALQNRIPVMGEFKPMTVAGGLMSYGPNQVGMWRRSAVYVDKIFRGADPANLPIEQPIKFELIINLKTAKALDLDVPPSLLVLAEDVIE